MTMESKMNTYRFGIYPLGDRSTWPTLEGMILVKPPRYGRGANHPWVVRLSSFLETSNRRTRVRIQCSNCSVVGHNCLSYQMLRRSSKSRITKGKESLSSFHTPSHHHEASSSRPTTVLESTPHDLVKLKGCNVRMMLEWTYYRSSIVRQGKYRDFKAFHIWMVFWGICLPRHY